MKKRLKHEHKVVHNKSDIQSMLKAYCEIIKVLDLLSPDARARVIKAASIMVNYKLGSGVLENE